MKCPSCAHLLAAPEPRCPACKLSLQKLDAKFGLVPRHSRYLSDRAGRLELSEMEEVREALRLFEKKFPQVLFSVFVTSLPGGSSVSEYAFWLANRARFNSIQKVRSENFDLLLVIDLGTNAAALTTGYALENYLSEDDLSAALAALRDGMRKGSLPDGIRACIAFLTRHLRARSRQPAKAQRAVGEVAA
ncbi:MAG: TPM domain-containing protein [Chthoniobacterales bacterium]